MRRALGFGCVVCVCLLGLLLAAGTAGASVGGAAGAGSSPSVTPRMGGLSLTAIDPTTGDNGTIVTCTVTGDFAAPNGALVGDPVFSLVRGATTIDGVTEDWNAVAGSATVSFALPANAPGGSYTLVATQKVALGVAAGALADAFTVNVKYPLLILADQSFLSALAPLVRFKDATGMPTVLRSWQDFQTQYASQAQTTQERIKRGIADYYTTYGTRYVMLVGNGDKFPIAWITGEGRQKIDNYEAIDLYYACLFKQDGSFDDWDGNANGYIGQVRYNTTGVIDEDGVNPVPDVGLGRLPASTVAQVSTYVAKVISYESASYNEDFTGDALVLASDAFAESPGWPYVPGTTAAASDLYASSYLVPQGLHVTKLYSGAPAGAADITAANFQSALNSGDLVVSFLGHGYDDGSGLAFSANTGYQIKNMTDVNGVALNNWDRLPVVFSGGCSTEQWANWPGAVMNGNQQYSTWVDVNGVTHKSGVVLTGDPPHPAPLQPLTDLPKLAFGEAMLMNGRYGAVAYYGSTMYAQLPNEIGECFWNGFAQSAATGRHLGDMWVAALNRWYSAYDPDPGTGTTVDDSIAKNMVFLQPWKYQLLGDPSLRVGGVAEAAPRDATLPVIGGTPARGAVLTCSTGSWMGCPYPSLHYQWLRNGATIAGATKASHVVGPADYHSVLSCQVTAVSAAGTATAESLGVSVTGNSANLVVNGNAERGSAATDDQTIVAPTGWKTTGEFTAIQYGASGGFPDAGVAAVISGGTAFFAGGGVDLSTATQTRPVPASWLSSVKHGKVKGVLSADLGGWADQEDYATVTAVFLNKSGHAIKSLRIGPVTEAQRGDETTLLARSRSITLPATTVKVRFVVASHRVDGAYNDGYADNLVFVLHR